jgi:lipopolysaccharide biosynthesis glycosyltransferase
MWEGPFEFYVWMDSDAILWGDITERIQTDLDFQIFWPETSISADADEVPEWLPHFYFKLEGVHKFDPDFEWRGHPYFSAGVYASRRNVISYEEWVDTSAWNDQVPGGIFQFGDQGLLNYLVLAKSQRGEIKTERTNLQWTRSWGHAELDNDCSKAGWALPNEPAKPMILHFCGRKPFVFDFKSYSRPFTIARLAHYRRNHSMVGALFVIFLEDTRVYTKRGWPKIKRILGLS